MQVSIILAPIAVFSVAAGLSGLALGLMLRASWPGGFDDVPNSRSLHRQPIPRFGGLAVHLAWVVVCLAVWATAGGAPVSPAMNTTISASLVLFAVSIVDDRSRLPVVFRLLAHFLCASAVIAASPGTGSAIIAALMVVAVVWGTNLYNFMDGANGLAGGMAVIGFGAYAWIATVAGDVPTAGVCASIAGAALGFLPYNLGRARVFLGDCGSVPLGFLAGAIGWLGFVEGTWEWWTPVLVFLPFIADATLTLLRRLARAERVWQAHREHVYQNLVLAGWSHARLARWAYAAMLAFAVLASILQNQSEPVQHVWVGVVVAGSVALLSGVDQIWGDRARRAASDDSSKPVSRSDSEMSE